MMPLEDIRRALHDRSPSKVAAATGLHFNTIRAIRDGRNENPKYRVLKALSDYLEANR